MSTSSCHWRDSPTLLTVLIAGLSVIPTASADPAPVLRHVDLKPVWKKPTLCAPSETGLDTDDARKARAWLEELYSRAIKARKAKNLPLIAPAVPVTFGDFVAYSNDAGVVACTLRETDYLGERVGAGYMAWEVIRDRGLKQMSRHLGSRYTARMWSDRYEPETFAEMMFGRSLSSALSVDGDTVIF